MPRSCLAIAPGDDVVKKMVGMLLLVIGGIVAVVFLGLGFHLWNHAQLRRDVLFDRQALFHSSDVFHVVTAISLAPGQELLDGVGRYVRAVEAQGSNIIHSMVRANALLVFPENQTDLPAGSRVEAILLEEGSALGAAPSGGSGAGTLLSTTTGMPGKC